VTTASILISKCSEMACRWIILAAAVLALGGCSHEDPPVGPSPGTINLGGGLGPMPLEGVTLDVPGQQYGRISMKVGESLRVQVTVGMPVVAGSASRFLYLKWTWNTNMAANADDKPTSGPIGLAVETCNCTAIDPQVWDSYYRKWNQRAWLNGAQTVVLTVTALSVGSTTLSVTGFVERPSVSTDGKTMIDIGPYSPAYLFIEVVA